MKSKLVIFVALITMLMSLNMIMSEEVLAVTPASTPTATPTLTSTPLYVDYAVNASAGPGGTVSPSGVLFAYPSSSFEFTITPNAGYQILDVSDNGVSKGALQTYELWDVQTNHQILAIFSKITQTSTPTSSLSTSSSPQSSPTSSPTATLSSSSTESLAGTYNVIIIAAAAVAILVIVATAMVVLKRRSK